MLDALEAVADHTNSPTLKQAVLEMRNSSGIMNYGAHRKSQLTCHYQLVSTTLATLATSTVSCNTSLP